MAARRARPVARDWSVTHSQSKRNRLLIGVPRHFAFILSVGSTHAHTPLPGGGHASMRGRFRTIWLSDTHLGTPGCQANALLDFLDTHECDFLYLVGDIIDFWRLKRSPHWTQLHNDVIRKILSKARAGTMVTLVPGNHDEYLRRFCDLQLGNIMVTREAIHRMTDGRLFLVVHGDEFD